MHAVSLTWLAAAVAVEAASMASFVLLQHRMLAAAGTRMRVRRMAAVALAANAMCVTLPGGTALSMTYTVRRIRASGAGAPAIAFTLVASGLLSGIAFALIGLGAAAGSDPSAGAVAGGALLLPVAALLWTQRDRALRLFVRVAGWTLRRLARLRRKPPPVSAVPLERFVAGLRAVEARPVDWLAGLAFAALNWLADLGCLVASCHAVGVDGVGIAVVACGYVAGMSASSFSFLPGGIGATDVAIVVALTHGGAGSAAAGAAVVCYRVISLGVVAAAGWLVWLVVRRSRWSRWRSWPGRRLGISRIRATLRIPNVTTSVIGPTRSAPSHHPHPYVLEQGLEQGADLP